MFSESARDQHRLPRVNLGPRHVSLPHPATASDIINVGGTLASRPSRRSHTLTHLQLTLVYSRSLKLRREDPADAFSVDQMSQSRAHARDRLSRPSHL